MDFRSAIKIVPPDRGGNYLILSAYNDEANVARGTAVGAVGFLEKGTATEFLAEAIREVAKGNRFFSPAIAKRRAKDKEQLGAWRGWASLWTG